MNNSKGDKTKLDSETPGKRKTTTHIYATGAGTSGQTPQGLTPHTDAYDVMVAQIQGTKLWTLCTPNPKTLSDVFREEGVNDGDMMVTEADKCELKLQEAFKKHDEASFYAEEDMKEFDCRNVTMNPGDTLYVPKGLVCILKYACTYPTICPSHSTTLLLVQYNGGSTCLVLEMCEWRTHIVEHTSV